MSPGKVAAALALILIGCYWLLSGLHLVSSASLAQFDLYIPLIILIFAAYLLIEPLLHHRRAHLFAGPLLAIYGGLLLADHYHFVHFHWQDFWQLWPYLIIYAGLSMLFGHRVFIHGYWNGKNGHWNKKRPHVIDAEWDGADEKFIHNADYRADNWMVRPMNEHVRIGDYDFDFTHAFIPEETTQIRISGWVGDLKIIVPDDLAFRVLVSSRVGDVKIGKWKQSGVLREMNYQTADYESATRRIDFKFDFQVIDLKINIV
ncbi:MAG: cell wall-active antibiotics response protein LiaF [Sporolactobacillus sp.]